MVGGAGFEPAKAVPADLQSAPVGRLGIRPRVRVVRGRGTSAKDRLRAARGRPCNHRPDCWRGGSGEAGSRETGPSDQRWTMPSLPTRANDEMSCEGATRLLRRAAPKSEPGGPPRPKRGVETSDLPSLHYAAPARQAAAPARQAKRASGASDGTRTHNPRITNPMLYQLSHAGTRRRRASARRESTREARRPDSPPTRLARRGHTTLKARRPGRANGGRRVRSLKLRCAKQHR